MGDDHSVGGKGPAATGRVEGSDCRAAFLGVHNGAVALTGTLFPHIAAAAALLNTSQKVFDALAAAPSRSQSNSLVEVAARDLVAQTFAAVPPNSNGNSLS